MPTPYQGPIQGLIQNTAGTQNLAQSLTPTAATAGNPNTVHNWGTYTPQLLPNPSGPPGMQFNLTQATPPVNNPASGYVSPFQPDPTAAAVMAGIPMAQPNENVNRILGNLFSGTNPWSTTTPVAGAPQPNPATGTPTTPTNPTTGRPQLGGPFPERPSGAGPISGPVTRDPLDWAFNFNNAMPATNAQASGVGRTATLEWLQQNADSFNQSTGGLDRDSDAWQGIWEEIKGIPGAIGNALRDTWEDATGQDGWRAAVSFWGGVAGIPGLEPLLGMIAPQAIDTAQLNRDVLARTSDQLAEQWLRTQRSIEDSLARNNAEQGANNNSGAPGFNPVEWYNNQPQHSDRDWRNITERFQFANMFNRTGMSDAMMNDIFAQDLQRSREWWARAGSRER
jgi:hypothetical protein